MWSHLPGFSGQRPPISPYKVTLQSLVSLGRMFSVILTITLALHSVSAQGTTSLLQMLQRPFRHLKLFPMLLSHSILRHWTFHLQMLWPKKSVDVSTPRNPTIHETWVFIAHNNLLTLTSLWSETTTEPNFFLVPVNATSPTNSLVLAIVDPDAPNPHISWEENSLLILCQGG